MLIFAAMLSELFRTKSLDRLVSEAEDPSHALKRTLGPIDVTALGIGAIIGAGIFATIGTAAAAASGMIPVFPTGTVRIAFTASYAAMVSATGPSSGALSTGSSGTALPSIQRRGRDASGRAVTSARTSAPLSRRRQPYQLVNKPLLFNAELLRR